MNRSSDGQGGRPYNPYATKKERRGLFTTPLEELDGFEEEEEKAAKPQQEQNTTESRVVSPNDHPSEAPAQETPSAPCMPMSVDLPPWKRIPTKTITLEPAEILTVSEACRHAAIYATKSIRTTGVLSHRYCHPETGQVSLVLKDPLSKLSKSQSTQVGTTAAKKKRRISFGSTPATSSSLNSSSTAKRKPSLGLARNRTTPLTSRKRPSSTFKTPLACRVPPRTPSSLPSRTPSSSVKPSTLPFRTPALSSRKRPVPTTTPRKLTPKEALLSALTHDNTLWIVPDPKHVPVDSLAIGDIFTVLGTVRSIQEGSAAGWIPKRKGNRPLWYVEARILRPDNGANLPLHWEALQLRRKHLLATYHPQPPITQPGTTLLLGCGPPPYNNLPGQNNGGDEEPDSGLT